MSANLSQRLIHSFKDKYEVTLESDYFARGLASKSAEECKAIGNRFSTLFSHCLTELSQLYESAVDKTNSDEEKAFMRACSQSSIKLSEQLTKESTETFGEPQKKAMAGNKSQLMVEYIHYLWDILNSQLIPGSIVPLLAAMLTSCLSMREVYKRMAENPIYGENLKSVKEWASDPNYLTIAALINKRSADITPEIGYKLRKICRKISDFQLRIYDTIYTGIYR